MSKWVDRARAEGRLREPEAHENKNTGGGFLAYWTTLPGVLTALAALITAVAGLIVALNRMETAPSPNQTPSPSQTASPKSSP